MSDPQIEDCQQLDFNPNLGILCWTPTACGDNAPTGRGRKVKINE